MRGSWHKRAAGDYRVSLIFGDLKDFPEEPPGLTSYGRRMRTRRRRYWIGIAVGAAAVGAALAATLALTTRASNDEATTSGVTTTVRLPRHPGWISAALDGLWVALNPSTERLVRRGSLVRLDASGKVERSIRMDGGVFTTARLGNRLFASLQPAGDDGFGRGRLLALDWRSGRVLASRKLLGPGGALALGAGSLWLLQVRPATLLRLDPRTLLDEAPPLRLSRGRAFGIAFGAGHVWVTDSEADRLIRIHPATRAITRISVGGFPVGVTVAGGDVWLAHRDDGDVVRGDPRTLKQIGESIEVGATPTYMTATRDYLFVANQSDGTVTRIDLDTGQKVGAPIRIAPPSEIHAAAFVPAAVGRAVWVSSFTADTITRIEPSP
jgi:outer membrane protein assembly factor BamB